MVLLPINGLLEVPKNSQGNWLTILLFIGWENGDQEKVHGFGDGTVSPSLDKVVSDLWPMSNVATFLIHTLWTVSGQDY